MIRSLRPLISFSFASRHPHKSFSALPRRPLYRSQRQLLQGRGNNTTSASSNAGPPSMSQSASLLLEAVDAVGTTVTPLLQAAPRSYKPASLLQAADAVATNRHRHCAPTENSCLNIIRYKWVVLYLSFYLQPVMSLFPDGNLYSN